MTYFAYASNLHPRQMQERATSHQMVCRARLPDHTLVFPRSSVYWEGGVASFTPSPGSNVWGVMYEITEADKNGLDQYEDVRLGAYRWVEVEVLDEAGTPHRVMTYQATAQGDHRPSTKYVMYILEGGRHWHLPAEWEAWWRGLLTS